MNTERFELQHLKKQPFLRSILDITILLFYVFIFWMLFTPKAPGFLIKNQFPWMEIFVIAIALRYGFFVSLIFIAGLITIGLNFSPQQEELALNTSASLFVGYTVTALICSEFKEFWQRKIERLTQSNRYLEQRFENLMYKHASLQLSHERLEQSLIEKPMSLREALRQINDLHLKEKSFTPQLVERYLLLLASYCALESAALFLFLDEKLLSTPIAKIGKCNTLYPKDILVTQCIKEKKALYFAVNKLEPQQHSHYLAVVPFKNSEQTLLGILVIEDLPFIHLHEANLSQLHLFLSYIADQHSLVSTSAAILTRYPSLSAFFITELIRLLHIAKTFSVDSTVVIYEFAQNIPHIDEIIETILKQKRGLDLSLHLSEKNTLKLYIVLPLTSKHLAQRYLARITALLHKKFGVNLGETHFYYQSISLLKYKDIFKLFDTLIPETDNPFSIQREENA